MPLRISLTATLATVFLLVISFTNATTTWAQQNVLLIIADDMGADSSGLYSSADTAPTPTIDGLALGGVRFTKAWATPTCSPTRSCLLTGRYGLRTGVGFAGNEIPLEEFTLPQALSSAGYATACIGKWHLNGESNGGDDNPILMGFDHYEGSLPGSLADYYQWTKVTKDIDGTSTTETVTRYATTETVDDAISWIGDQGNQPWFCQVAFNAPHDPFQLPPTSLHGFGNASDTPAIYKAMIEAMDTEMGRLLSSIDANTLANTNVIFVGDNGPPRSVVPGTVRGWKVQLYEGGVHVPFIISGPAVASPGRTQDSTIHVVDIFSTALELVGLSPDLVIPNDLVVDSISVAPYLFDPSQTNIHNFAFTERFRDPLVNQDGEAIRNATYKLIRFFNSGNQEMYNLDTDPTESTNLLDGSLTNNEQANFDGLSLRLDQLRFGDLVVTPEVISSTDFEDGLGIWIDGGNDCRRNINDASFAGSGSYCVRLRDDSTSSRLTTIPLDLSGYQSVQVDFHYFPRGLEGSEGFEMQFSVDGGNSFDVANRWTLGNEITNNQPEVTSAAIAGGLAEQTVIRFVCDGSNNQDWIYLDDIQITATP